LPPNYRYYLGGSSNLRGFEREELPGPDGALSAAFTSLELRVANWIPYGIQPLAFVDVGILGDQAFRFNAPVYYSPGFGLRYESPIGVFRTTFAWGMKSSEADANPDNTHFQFFFGFGEEF
ncbi:MAG TPA: BamA/TamA family outer membrane protein, partial [bacterium]|nr:BamA/TamA family outer membrane protein [bacterium]